MSSQTPKPDVNLLLQLEMLKVLKKLQKTGGELGEEGATDIDGLRVVKALSHMRTMKAKFVNNPTTICRDYSRAWEERLGAEGKPWTWDGDVLKAINFGKYRSMLRVFAMFGAVKALLPEAR